MALPAINHIGTVVKRFKKSFLMMLLLLAHDNPFVGDISTVCDEELVNVHFDVIQPISTAGYIGRSCEVLLFHLHGIIFSKVGEDFFVG